MPLVDAIATALIAAYEEGRADAGGDPVEQAAAHRVTMAAIAEVQRLYGQFDLEVRHARKAPGPSRGRRTG